MNNTLTPPVNGTTEDRSFEPYVLLPMLILATLPPAIVLSVKPLVSLSYAVALGTLGFGLGYFFAGNQPLSSPVSCIQYFFGAFLGFCLGNFISSTPTARMQPIILPVQSDEQNEPAPDDAAIELPMMSNIPRQSNASDTQNEPALESAIAPPTGFDSNSGLDDEESQLKIATGQLLHLRALRRDSRVLSVLYNDKETTNKGENLATSATSPTSPISLSRSRASLNAMS